MDKLGKVAVITIQSLQLPPQRRAKIHHQVTTQEATQLQSM